MSELCVLNAYAGIGGNRHLWPASWHVTAVEIDPRVAAEYARRYPNDTVLVEDAHAHVMERAHEYDAQWTSPPCPTHSRLAVNVAKRKGVEPAPDPRLWAEIEHLRALGGHYVVENVHTYYAPPIPPDVVTERHYYWTSAPPLTLTPVGVLPVSGRRVGLTADAIAESYGLPPLPAGSVADRRKAMRNAVVPHEGYEIATAAFAPQLVTTGSADPVHPPMPVGHIRACGCPECVAWLEAHEPAERCSMCRDGVSHSARCHHDEHEVCDRVAEGTDAPKSCACPCHSPADLVQGDAKLRENSGDADATENHKNGSER